MRANSDWLTRHSECLEQLTAWTSDALIVTDRDMRLRAWNRGAELMSGWDRAEVLGCEPPFFPPGARDLAVERWRWVVEHGDTIANFEIQPVTKDGRRVSLVATLSPVIGPGADVVGVVAIAKEIGLLKALQAQQRSQAREVVR